ncbi:MAG TPA: zinc-dependent alcohol dehydrogenase, partial [Anaerolineales bacterium]|nr:zinc-dependent alcohol dehydrogenase [Anaerolineales bacterium]
MKAVCWNGIANVDVEEVPDPILINPRDAIVRITSTAICGSDLHLYNGYIPTMKKGDILGHEFMGEVVELGKGVKNLKVGDRVIVPAVISCGNCFFCERGLYSLCDNSNPNPALAEGMYGHSAAGVFGFSHLMGGYAGGQAEYARVPFADVGPFKIENGFRDEQVLFLTDIFPTGYMAAEQANIQPGDTVAVWGCGPVGQFVIQSAWTFNPARVIAIDRFPERLEMAQRYGRAEVIDYSGGVDVVETLKQMTGGMGPDVCIDAVGMEAYKPGIEGAVDYAKQTVKIESDRPYVLRECIQACRKGGTVSLIGVYSGFVDML